MGLAITKGFGKIFHLQRLDWEIELNDELKTSGNPKQDKSWSFEPTPQWNENVLHDRIFS